MEKIIEFIKPELLILIPVLYFIGMGLKKAESFADKYIPVLLGLFGVLLAVLWVFATTEIANTQAGFMAAFTAVTQGILCAGASTYANQIIKQAGKEE